MRVIAGRFKGRRLRAPVRGLRPSADSLRERLFAVLGQDLQPGLGVDLFCGVGTLGIEALSRGAQRLIFVDSERRHLRVLEENLTPLREAGLDIQVVCADARRFVAEAWPAGPVDWVFLDPPYGDPAGQACLSALARLRGADLDWVIFEGAAEQAAPAGLRLARVLDCGGSRVTLMRGGLAP
jgi:16S rRNA (guanine(966)-N(2))-methyltransferase RsmD